MKLGALLGEIRESRGPVTGIELAARLGLPPAQVASMLAALRASGALGAEVRLVPSLSSCSSAGACSLACPGPGECSLVVNFNVTTLEIGPNRATTRAGGRR